MKEYEARESKEFYLKKGLNAIIMPELQDRNADLKLEPVTPEEAVHRLQKFLDEIERQGGEVLGVVSVPVRQPVDLPPPHSTRNYIVGEPKQIFIVRKGIT